MAEEAWMAAWYIMYRFEDDQKFKNGTSIQKRLLDIIKSKHTLPNVFWKLVLENNKPKSKARKVMKKNVERTSNQRENM